MNHQRRAASEPASSASRPPRGPRWLWAVVAALLVLAVLAFLLVPRFLERPPPDVGPLDPSPTPATLGVAGLFVEPDDGRQPILDELAAARESIWLLVYLLSDDEIITALETAAARGVTVRVMLEQHPFGGGGGQEALFDRLQQAGVDVRWSNPVFRFSHIKTFVIDGRVAIIMNLNLTRSAFTSNRELAVITTRPGDVTEAAAIFAADWERADAPTLGSLVVSPTNSRQELLALIDRAEASLDIYAEVTRDPELLGAIIGAVERGVAVRLVMSGEANDSNARDRAWLATSGVEVRLLSRPYIHAKMFLADDREVFVGSQNMTATSLDQNRELGIILTDAGSIERAGRVFAQDFQAGRPEGP